MDMGRSASFLILIFLAVAVCAYELQNAKAQGTIYIRANGSIEPVGAAISSFDNVTYAFTGDISQTIAIERDNVVVKGFGHMLQGNGTGYGFFLGGRNNVTISDVNIRSFDAGVRTDYCLGTRILNNNMTDNHHAGIWLFLSNSSWICQNRITRNLFAGIILDASSTNIILENDVRDNGESIRFEYSFNGIDMSSDNAIFHNNFVNGSVYTYFAGSPENSWDNGYPSGGNFWSDYFEKYPNAAEIDASRIWDTPYAIDANNTDRYPLMGEYAIPEFSLPLVLPSFMVATFLAVIMFRRKNKLS